MQNYDARIDGLIDTLQELKLTLTDQPVEFTHADQPPEPYKFIDTYELIDNVIEELGSL